MRKDAGMIKKDKSRSGSHKGLASDMLQGSMGQYDTPHGLMEGMKQGSSKHGDSRESYPKTPGNRMRQGGHGKRG